MVGIRLTRILERVHQLGFIYNDLKLDNIIIGTHAVNTTHQIRLIDFGLATRYLNETGQHIKESYCQHFTGNIALASQNALKFKTVSRRDDMISLAYLLVYMAQGSLPFLNFDQTKYKSK